MAYSAIVKPQDYFNTVLYTGNGGTQTISGVGFQPDFLWIKTRSGAGNHMLQNAVRGSTKHTHSNTNDAEVTDATGVTSFNSDGFAVSSNGNLNGNGTTIASWNWKANGTGSANTAGSINSTVSVSTTSGFSIVSYTGNGTGNSTVGHGLGATPTFIIVKNLTTAQSWGTKSDSFVSASEPRIIYLNATDSYANDTNVWGTSAAFNNNTFTVGDWNGSNQSSSNFIAYCFSEKQGFSKFSSYTGNGNADGPFVYTGFKPAFLMAKRSNGTGPWIMFDNKRDVINVANHRLKAETSLAELSGDVNIYLDFLSNGFKLRNADTDSNASGSIYDYMSFAEEPLVANSGTDGVPATAR